MKRILINRLVIAVCLAAVSLLSTLAIQASPDLGADEILPPGCEAYPLGLSKYLLHGSPPGSPLTALFSDSLYGIGILRWDPDPASNNIGYVVKELRQPELSLTGYTGMLNAGDHSLSAGDAVAAYTGLPASNDFNAEIYRLQASGAVLRVPTWSTRGGSDPNRYYAVDRFVLVKITDFHPEQPDMPVTFIYLGE
ncbi:MAG: hypothetical protein D6784_07705, partial [Chloroflexi bacterium]